VRGVKDFEEVYLHREPVDMRKGINVKRLEEAKWPKKVPLDVVVMTPGFCQALTSCR
jgi:hypothetical protein